MRIAVMSDIHGNCVGLDAVLGDLQAQAVDQIVCLGDAVQGGPQPAQVVGRLRVLRCPVVMGNADAWLLSGEETSEEAISSERLRAMHEVRAWSLAQLSAEDQAFIATFAPTIEIDLGGARLLAYHGSPHSFDDIILPDTPQEQLAAFLSSHTADLYCGGHTHVQDVARTYTILMVEPYMPGRQPLAVSLVRRLLAWGWRRGYEQVAGALSNIAWFYVWAGA